MPKLFLLYLITIYINTTSCSQKTVKNQKTDTTKNENILFADTSKFAIFENKSEIESIFDKNYKPSILNKSEYTLMRNLVIQFIDSLNIRATERWKIYTSRYKFQIIVVVNTKKQKIVWINAFCDDFDMDWRKKILWVEDGGICYFHLTINLTAKKLLSFIRNGIA